MFLFLLMGEDERKRIESAAVQEQVEILVLNDTDPLLAALAEGGAKAVFLDVTSFELDGLDLLARIKSNPATRLIPVVAFGNSLRADLLEDARESGADLVLPRSAFHDQLPNLMRHYR